jgi:tetratricopeptide (TPR) repeat protein
MAGKHKGKKVKEVIFPSLVYIGFMLFNLIVLYRSGTRGSFAGLVVGVLLIALILAIKERGIKRKVGVSLLVAMVVVVAFFGAAKNTDFIKNNSLLYRFSSLVTFDVGSVIKTQGEARLLLWNMALKGVKERPILGWGQDNFSYVFSKYYDPKMYAQEQWFDRTHNVFLDWLIAGGILALIGYLSLFYAVLYMLWRGPKKSAADSHEWNVTEKAVFTGLLAAYFVHNLFVFDNLSSYILFFILLAYVAERYNAMAHEPVEHAPLVADKVLQSVAVVIIIGALVATSYVVVYKPYMAGKHLILALFPNLVGPNNAPLAAPDAAAYRLNELTKALSYNTFGNTEIRERLTDVASEAFGALAGGSSLPPVMMQLDGLVSSEYKKQLEETPNDARAYVFYAMYLQRIGAYAGAIPYADKAVSLSPTKQSFLVQKGTLQIAAGMNEQAIETLKTAYELEPRNTEVGIIYAAGLIYAEKYAEAKAFIGSNTAVAEDTRVIQAYFAKGKYAEVIQSIKNRIAVTPNDGQLHMSLAGVYLKTKQKALAIAEVREAIRLSPQFTQLGNYYIKEIQAGRDPSTEPTPTQAQLDAANK